MPNTMVKSYWSSGGLVFAPQGPTAAPPSVMIQVGDTNGVLSTGVTGIYGWIKHNTTAVTGTTRAVRGNATCLVASTAGEMIGVEGRASNASSATATDGVNLGTAYGGHFFVVGGTATATITTAAGVRAHLDIDQAGLTTTTAYGVLINIQTGAGTTTNLYGLSIEHEAGSGTADTMTAAIRVRCVNGNEPMTCLIDASGCGPIGSGDTYNLFKLPSGSGKTYLRWDVSDSAWSQTS